MFKNYLKTAWRSLVRNKSFSLINITGLSIGIAASLLLFIVVEYELSYDTFQPDYNRIYRVVTQDKFDKDITYNGGIPVPALAIFISCLGLYGLVSFMAVQKTKEVGIRKVLGASITSLLQLFSREFTILIIISFFIAVPVAWYMMHGWLNNFVYRIPLSIWFFLITIAGSILIAWITVGYKALRAALANPMKSLRSE